MPHTEQAVIAFANETAAIADLAADAIAAAESEADIPAAVHAAAAHYDTVKAALLAAGVDFDGEEGAYYVTVIARRKAKSREAIDHAIKLARVGLDAIRQEMDPRAARFEASASRLHRVGPGPQRGGPGPMNGGPRRRD